MKRPFLVLAIAVSLTASTTAGAAERTVTLAVERMTCAACPVFVRSALRGVDGVTRVKVSYEKKTATVTFDDRRAKVSDLIEATNSIGYPSRSLRSGQ